jgi:hypothetical protein
METLKPMQGTDGVHGVEELTTWFGSWPSFHDAEVLSIELRRSESSHLRIHAWEMTGDVGSEGHYILRKHVVVTFTFEEIFDLQPQEFIVQNVISGLKLQRCDDGYELSMSPCFGVSGYIKAKQVQVSFKPGKPADQ